MRARPEPDGRALSCHPVKLASSSKPSAHSLPQNRRTLSSGFSQYQHEPFGGKLWRGRGGANGGADASMLASSSGKLSCTVPKIPPFVQQRAYVLQQDYFSGISRGMRFLKQSCKPGVIRRQLRKITSYAE